MALVPFVYLTRSEGWTVKHIEQSNGRFEICGSIDFLGQQRYGRLGKHSKINQQQIKKYSKKDGGIRPIAVGNTLRRLAAKVVLSPVTAEIREQVQPTQLGVGTPGGCEAALRATRAYMEQATSPKVLLKIDLKNAFNTLPRNKILTAVRGNIPEAYHFFYQAYGAESIL